MFIASGIILEVQILEILQKAHYINQLFNAAIMINDTCLIKGIVLIDLTDRC